MPNYVPPAGLADAAHGHLLPARTLLWRVHGAHRGPCEFKRMPTRDCDPGGRFDSTPTEPFGYAYLARAEATAIAEKFLRSLQFDDAAGRLIPFRALQGRRLSCVEVVRELRLTALLSAVDLAAIGQDDWLVQAEPAEFPDTRRWARWVRQVDRRSQGLIWQSRRDRPHDAIVLFEDRCQLGSPLRPSGRWHVDLDSPEGTDMLRAMLRPYRVSVEVSER